MAEETRQGGVVCERCGAVIPLSESIEKDITPVGAGMSFRKTINICKDGCKALNE